MDFFINTFMTVLGLGFGLVALYVSLRILPALVMLVARKVTTRRWQAARYRQIVAEGTPRSAATAQFAVRHGWATEE